MMQQEYIGLESISNFEGILSKHKPSHIFLVTGKKSYEKSGAKKIIEQYLKDYNVTHFYDFEVNPKLPDIEKGIQLFKENNCDFVIVVGGGSVIDVAKSVNLLAANSGRPEYYIQTGASIESQGAPLIAIPTTSGSGSEATKFAVVYVNGVKYSLEHPSMLPDYSIVDSQFTSNLPPDITAVTGMDALSQGIESFWSINSTDESREYAREAIQLVFGSLKTAVKNPEEQSRLAMSRGAHLAGKAINISKTTASHAISYTMTSKFGIPHGHAVALTLWPIMVYNYGVTEEDIQTGIEVETVKRTIEEPVALLGVDNVSEASDKIKTLMHDIGLKTELSGLGITNDSHIDLIVDGVNYQRLGNNPRKLTKETLRNILHSIQ